MSAKTGYLLIADITGYTAYLTSTEFDHANGVIAGLLEALVSQLDAPLQLWRLEGDAVLAYTTDPHFPDGHTFLTICESLYGAFIGRRSDIHANSSCPCKACAKVPELDLKILVHHGTFEEMTIGPMRDISGPDVILVHRMAKTGVKSATGIESYALLSDAAFVAMGEPTGMIGYSEAVEHFGDVKMHTHDLKAAWSRSRANRIPAQVSEAEALWVKTIELPLSPTAAWEIVLSARNRRQWMDMIDVRVETEDGRPVPGARYHCVHRIGEFSSWLVDWEPFRYFTIRYVNAYHPHLSHYETYTLSPTEQGVEFRYAMGPMFDPENPDAGPYPSEDVQYRDFYIELMTPWFVDLKRQVDEDLGAYAHATAAS